MEAVAETIQAPPVESMFVDLRRHTRFNVQSGAIASPSLTVMGQIVNVSKEGLVFRYVASRQRSNESMTLNITLTDGSFRVDWMPFKVVWDVPAPESYCYGPISLRYCGVQFGDLTDHQRLRLHYFIKNYTTAEPEA